MLIKAVLKYVFAHLEQLQELHLIKHLLINLLNKPSAKTVVMRYVSNWQIVSSVCCWIHYFRKKFWQFVSHQGFQRSSDLHQIKYTHSWLISIRALFSTEGML